MTAPANKESSPARRSWLPASVSLVFSAAAIEMLVLYGWTHEQILLRETQDMPQHAATLLAHLGWLRIIFAALAMLTTVHAFRAGPRWTAFIALAGSLLALLTLGLIL